MKSEQIKNSLLNTFRQNVKGNDPNFNTIRHFWHKYKYNNIYISITKIKDDLRHKGIIYAH